MFRAGGERPNPVKTWAAPCRVEEVVRSVPDANKIVDAILCAAIALGIRFGDEMPARSLLGSRAKRFTPRWPGAPTGIPARRIALRCTIFIGLGKPDVPGHKTDRESQNCKQLAANCEPGCQREGSQCLIIPALGKQR